MDPMRGGPVGLNRRGFLVAAALFSAALGYVTSRAVSTSSPSSSSSVVELKPVPTPFNGKWALLPDYSCAPAKWAGAFNGPATGVSTEVANGTTDGDSWSLWAPSNVSGAAAIEGSGFVLNGAWYGVCQPPFSPLRVVMVSADLNGVVYGYAANITDAAVEVVGEPSGDVVRAAVTDPLGGGTFFVAALPESACLYSSLEVKASGENLVDRTQLDFGKCAPDAVVPVTHEFVGTSP